MHSIKNDQELCSFIRFAVKLTRKSFVTLQGYFRRNDCYYTQLAFTCLTLAIETLKKGVKYVQS